MFVLFVRQGVNVTNLSCLLWLTLLYTIEDVYVCGTQGNMAVPAHYTFSLFRDMSSSLEQLVLETPKSLPGIAGALQERILTEADTRYLF